MVVVCTLQTRGALAAGPEIFSVYSAQPSPRGRLRTVPPELPRGSGDAALASPAVVPELGKSRCPEGMRLAAKREQFLPSDSLRNTCKKYK